MLIELILFTAFSYSNSKLAQRKGLTSLPWVLRTIGAIFLGMFIGAIFISAQYKGALDIANLQKFLFKNPLLIITYYACAVGGGLLVRYLLDKKPNPTNQE
jgi:hypothetical protein